MRSPGKFQGGISIAAFISEGPPFGERQQLQNFVVCDACEIFVPPADGEEGVGDGAADYLISFGPEVGAGFGRGDGDGDDAFPGSLATERARRSQHGGTGGEAIIDQDDGAAGYFALRTTAAIHLFAAAEFFVLTGADGIHHFVGDAEFAQKGRIENAHAIGGKGAEGQFFVARNAEFTNDQDIEGRMESLSHFEGDGHASAG
jgi:hypothetical protein